MFRLSVVRQLRLVVVAALILVGGTLSAQLRDLSDEDPLLGDRIETGPSVCNCCSGGDGLGCDCEPCEVIVCAVDPFCCEQMWDEVCDQEAAVFCTCCTDGCETDFTFFTVEQEFKDACGAVLTTEDFSCSAAEPGGVCTGQPPLNSSTDDGCFDACLVEGFEFNVSLDFLYAAVGTGFLGVGLPAVGPNAFSKDGSFSFSSAAGCVGFKVIGDLITPVNVICTFQPTGLSATIHGTLEGVFIGAIDPAGITEVECVGIGLPAPTELFGALQFVDAADPPPVAASDIWSRIALIGVLLIGSLFFLRRRAEAQS